MKTREASVVLAAGPPNRKFICRANHASIHDDNTYYTHAITRPRILQAEVRFRGDDFAHDVEIFHLQIHYHLDLRWPPGLSSQAFVFVATFVFLLTSWAKHCISSCCNIGARKMYGRVLLGLVWTVPHQP